MKKRNITITPFRKEDKKYAKLMEIIANSQWEEYGKIVEAIARVKFQVSLYGVDIGDEPWESIMREVVAMRMSIDKNSLNKA